MLGLLSATEARAAVVATAGPGWRQEGDVQNIDIDGDGIRDFFVATWGNELNIVPAGNNRILSGRPNFQDSHWSVSTIDEGGLIGATSEFGGWYGLETGAKPPEHFGALIYACYGLRTVGLPDVCISNLSLDRINYFGVEFERDGLTRFGWIAVNTQFIGAGVPLGLAGWAYETEPGHAIAAGAIPEPSAAVLIGGSAALLWHRNASNRKENKSAAANRCGLSVFIAWCRSKVQRVWWVFSRPTCR